MKKIALIAHDNMKPEIVKFVSENLDFFSKETLVSTGTTGLRIQEATNLEIQRFQSGPIGGDQQIGALIATNEIKAIFFMRDPLTAQPHEPDITALIRLADVHKVPVATNLATAELIVKGLQMQ